jgi:hypothetical protein
MAFYILSINAIQIKNQLGNTARLWFTGIFYSNKFSGNRLHTGYESVYLQHL